MSRAEAIDDDDDGAGGPGPPRPGPSGRDVFEILLREHADMLTTYLRTLVDDPGARDDLFQETAIVAWRRLGDFDHARPFGPWLRGIARTLAVAHHRQRSRDPVWCEGPVLEALDRRFEALQRRPGDRFRDRVDRLLACMARLPDRMREVVELAYARGMLGREIAGALGTTEEAIKKRLQRARHLLVTCLGVEID